MVIWLLESTGKLMPPSILVKRWPLTPASTSWGLSSDQGRCSHCSVVCGKIRWCRKFCLFMISKRKWQYKRNGSCESLVLVGLQDVPRKLESASLGKKYQWKVLISARWFDCLKKKSSMETSNMCVCWWSPVGPTGCQPVHGDISDPLEHLKGSQRWH